MRFSSVIRKLIVGLALALVPAASFAAVFISVGIAPPVLPVYTQPVCPGDGYMWTPGYWAYGPEGYYWVPGVWVMAPQPGLLWTPAYWGWGGSAFIFHSGYWGPHVGFYGGINYGFGYGGVGFGGGRWVGGRFAYNTAVVNVNRTVIHNVYEDRTVINHGAYSRTSFNGGAGGINARPNAQEAAFGRENHVAPTAMQQQHFDAARSDRGNLASVNGGRPQMAAARTTGEYHASVQQRGGFGGSQGGQRPGGQANNFARPAQGNNNAARPAAQAQARPQQQQAHPQAQAQARPQAHEAHEGGGHPR